MTNSSAIIDKNEKLISLVFCSWVGLLFIGYLTDTITGLTYLTGLSFMSIMYVFLFFLSKKEGKLRRVFLCSWLSTCILVVYEFPLILNDEEKFIVSRYNAPDELGEGSGIYALSVLVEQVRHVEDEQVLRDMYFSSNTQFYEITPISNLIRYNGKTNALLELLGVLKSDLEQMEINTKAYLESNNVQEGAHIRNFLEKKGLYGDSAGLALVLASLAEENLISNKKQIAVTGAIDSTGVVREVGLIKEKVLIASESQIPYMLVPTLNYQEANEVKNTLKLAIEINGVKDVKDAIELIGKINGNED